MYIRSAFTQIELVFVMVIAGILAVTAIPKLAGSRDSAALAIDVVNMGACITDANSYYTVYGEEVPIGYSVACDNIKCFTTTMTAPNYTVATNASGAGHCRDIEDIGGHLAKTYRF